MKPRPDYQIHLKYRASAYDVARLQYRAIEQHYVSANLELVQKVLNTAAGVGGATVGNLDQDGLQRAYFELRLIEVGAMSTYDRVRHQGIALSTPTELYTASLYELKQLLNCASNVGYNSAIIQSILKMAGHGLPPENQTLSGLDATGMEVVYKQVLRLLVNPIEFVRTHHLDFHPIT